MKNNTLADRAVRIIGAHPEFGDNAELIAVIPELVNELPRTQGTLQKPPVPAYIRAIYSEIEKSYNASKPAK